MPQVFHDIHCLVRLPPKIVYPTDYYPKNYVREFTLGRPSMHQESTEERLIHVIKRLLLSWLPPYFHTQSALSPF